MSTINSSTAGSLEAPDAHVSRVLLVREKVSTLVVYHLDYVSDLPEVSFLAGCPSLSQLFPPTTRIHRKQRVETCHTSFTTSCFLQARSESSTTAPTSSTRNTDSRQKPCLARDSHGQQFSPQQGNCLKRRLSNYIVYGSPTIEVLFQVFSTMPPTT